MAELVSGLAEHLGMEGRELTKLRLAAQLHDLGKVSLPEEDGYCFGAEATDGYRTHPELGAEALKAAGPDVTAAIRHHHERWDGAGFPDGLAGEEAPIGGRLIALADAIDRVSHSDGSRTAAMEHIETEAGAAYDPELARLAVQIFSD